MPAKPPMYRHRDGWWGRLILQVREQYYAYGGEWMWGQWRDAKTTDLPPLGYFYTPKRRKREESHGA